MHIWAINLQQGSQEYTMESQDFAIVFSINSAGATGDPYAKK